MENLKDLFESLDARLDHQTKTAISAMSELEAKCSLHLSLNGLIRSLVFYRNHSRKGKEFFERLGMPDDASGILGMLYWHRLRGDPITTESVAEILSQSWYLLPEDVLPTAELLVAHLAQ